MGNSNPWDRQTQDTDESWPAFQIFRDMRRPRTLYLAPGNVRVPIELARKWHRDHDWKTRVDAFDEYLDDLRTQEVEALTKQSAAEVVAEHMATLKSARELVAREIEKLLGMSKESENTALRPRELTSLLEAVIKYDRLIRDQSTEKTETSLDLSKLSIDELKTLEQLHRKIEGSSGDSERVH
jgi:hypothetical protein